MAVIHDRTAFFIQSLPLQRHGGGGLTYALHGLAGLSLIALVMMHVNFGFRPEKLPITHSMNFGWMSRDFYLKEHDPSRRVVTLVPSPEHGGTRDAS